MPGDAKQQPDVRRDEEPQDLPERQPGPGDDATVKGGARAVPLEPASPPFVPIPYPN